VAEKIEREGEKSCVKTEVKVEVDEKVAADDSAQGKNGETAVKDKSEENKVEVKSESEEKTPPAEKTLRCVLRVGALAKGLLLKGESKCELVLVCAEKPTDELIEKVFKMLSETVEKCQEDCSVEKTGKTMVVSTNGEDVSSAVIHFTCPLVQPETADSSDEFDVSCLELNQKVRQVKWWQARASIMQTCVIITRLMKDFCIRMPMWECMKEWTIEVLVQTLVENAMDSLNGFALTPATAFNMIFQSLSSGLLLDNGDVITDPTLRGNKCIFEYLTDQQKEAMTMSAQRATRYMAFHLIEQVLGLEVHKNNN